jgi:hypothetical protein
MTGALERMPFNLWRLNPEVPAGRWFKRFPTMTVCGDGTFIKTFLTPFQAPFGDEL